MYPERWKDPEDRSRRDRLVVAMGEWVHSLAPWDTYATMTFARQYSVDGVAKRVGKFMAQKLPGVSYFAAEELNPDYGGNNPGAHAHVLMVDLQVKRKQVWAEWFKSHGNSRILPIVERQTSVLIVAENGYPCEPYAASVPDRGMTVADYCAKYVCKGGTWWHWGLTPWRKGAVAEELVLDA